MQRLALFTLVVFLAVGCAVNEREGTEQSAAQLDAGATQSVEKGFPTSLEELMFSSRPPLTENETAFLAAATDGDLEKVTSLLAEGVQVDIYDDSGYTALSWAAGNNHKNVVEFLVEKKAYLDAGAGIGGTPLATAAYEGHLEIVELLIASGADRNAKDGLGRMPLDAATGEAAKLLNAE